MKKAGVRVKEIDAYCTMSRFTVSNTLRWYYNEKCLLKKKKEGNKFKLSLRASRMFWNHVTSNFSIRSFSLLEISPVILVSKLESVLQDAKLRCYACDPVLPYKIHSKNHLIYSLA